MAIRKVLLIHPPFILKSTWEQEMASFPMGLAYLAAALTEKGYETEILDCFIEDQQNRKPISDQLIRVGLADREILQRVEQFGPDVVGISIPFSCQLKSSLHIHKKIREAHPKCITLAGGNHVSAVPESMLKEGFDWLVLGEGELGFVELLDTLNKGDDPGHIGNVLSPHHKNLGGKRLQLIENLDSLPFASYDHLNLEKYWIHSEGRRYVDFIATRGCPYDCVFCSIHTIMGRRLRRRSVDHVLREIDHLVRDYQIEEIFFEDDNLTADRSWAKKLFTAIAERNYGLKLFFRNGLRADSMDLELLEKIKEAGGTQVSFAPESGSQTTLDEIINKKMKLEDVERAVKLSKQVGLDVACFLVIGFPDETLEDIQNTIDYGHTLRDWGCDSVWISCATPYPGTRLYKQCVERGILNKEMDYQSLSTMDAMISNEWFSAEQLKTIRDQAMKSLNPESLKTKIRKVLQKTRLGRFFVRTYKKLTH
jgi:anaerobic magnesium-protoporphyrin IX monomethyl ester cyclase